MKNNNTQAFRGNKSSLALEYAAREILKEHGWHKYHSKGDNYEKADGLEFVIFAHFHRSKESYQGEHPALEEYSSHWIAANANSLDADVIDILIKRYGPVEGDQMIAPHMSYWE